MTIVAVPLSEQASQRLADLAEQVGVTREELARAGLEDWLTRPRDDFVAAAKHVFEKNRELYRRLA